MESVTRPNSGWHPPKEEIPYDQWLQFTEEEKAELANASHMPNGREECSDAQMRFDIASNDHVLGQKEP